MEKNESISFNKSNIRGLFTKIDTMYPTFTIDLINELIRLHSKTVNINEMILRSEKNASSDGEFFRICNTHICLSFNFNRI